MAIIVELPRLSDTMEEGVIAKWRVNVGDKVKRGQVIADIETDKATMEFESFDAGTVLELIAPEGETLALGAPIAVLGSPGEDPKAALEGRGGAPAKKGDTGKGEARKGKKEEAEEEEAEDEEEAEEEEGVEDEEETAKPKPSSAPTEIPRTAPAKAKAKAPAPKPAPSKAEAPRDGSRRPASPLARKLAREHGLSLDQIEGSGPRGRIVKSDVLSAAEGRVEGRAGTMVTQDGRSFLTRPDTPMKLSQMRKAIARRMAQANAEIPHFYLRIVVDMTQAVALRQQLGEALPDVKISFNDIVVFAVARALAKHPEVNAYWDGETIVRRGDIHVGIAVALDDGLIVPVVKHADQKSLSAIAADARDLGTRAKEKKLAPDEMVGSTFTVSNLGMFGVEEFSAVINPGEGAILAVGAIVDEPVVVGSGDIGIRKRMRMTLACDHRVMDGAGGARFMATLRGLLEKPLAMLA